MNLQIDGGDACRHSRLSDVGTPCQCLCATACIAVLRSCSIIQSCHFMHYQRPLLHTPTGPCSGHRHATHNGIHVAADSHGVAQAVAPGAGLPADLWRHRSRLPVIQRPQGASCCLAPGDEGHLQHDDRLLTTRLAHSTDCIGSGQIPHATSPECTSPQVGYMFCRCPGAAGSAC